MNPELSIKIDYLKDRHNPEEVFEAMALYINAYRDFGQVLSNSIGIKADFNFQLNEIKSGSILSKLSVIPGKIDEILANAFYNSGDELFRELTDIETTDTEEQVETLAVNLETALAKKSTTTNSGPQYRQTKSIICSRKILNCESKK